MSRLVAFINNPRAIGGVFGLLFVVLFIVGGPIMQGDTPRIADSAADVRRYWQDDHTRYLAGDFIFAIAILFGFVPFAVATARVLRSGDGSDGMWTGMVLAGALVGALLGGAGAAVTAGAAILGGEGLDDSTLLFITRASAYSFQGVALGFGLMLVSAAIIIAQSHILGRWLAVVAAAAALSCVAGGLWVPMEDDQGVAGALSFAGVMGGLGWVALVSIQFLVARSTSEA